MNNHNTKEGKEKISSINNKSSLPKTGENEPSDIEVAGELDAGFVHDLDQDSIGFEPQKHRAKTASYLAFTLVAILGLSLLIHYIATLILCWYGQVESAKSLGQIFDKWLPVISGFVGGAVTYYFTKEKT